MKRMSEQAVSIVEEIERLEASGASMEDIVTGEVGPALGQCFEITDKAGAAWALRKMSKVQAKIAETNAAAEAEIKLTQAWRDKENGKLELEIDFFTYLLDTYFRRCQVEDPKLKTLKLPHGSLKMRAQQPEFTYDDEPLLAWAKESLPTAVVVKESVAKQPVKDWIKETGEVPAGVTISNRPDKFSVEVL